MKLVDFMTKVVSDRDWMERFCKDPRGTVKRAGLGDKAMAALKSGDSQHVAYVICVDEAPRSGKFDPID